MTESSTSTPHLLSPLIHETADPEVIVVEQTAAGTSAATGREFALPNIVVLKVRGGQIVRIRDYVNVLAAAEAAGRQLSS